MTGNLRAGRRTWPASTGLLAGYCWLALTTAVAVAAGGTHRPDLALALLSVAALAVGTRTTTLAAAGVGAMAWFFYDGFIAGRHADLAWHGAGDVRRLVLLIGAGLAGAAIPALAGRSVSGPDVRNY